VSGNYCVLMPSIKLKQCVLMSSVEKQFSCFHSTQKSRDIHETTKCYRIFLTWCTTDLVTMGRCIKKRVYLHSGNHNTISKKEMFAFLLMRKLKPTSSRDLNLHICASGENCERHTQLFDSVTNLLLLVSWLSLLCSALFVTKGASCSLAK
jgi:hypothetical protein